MTVGEYLVSRSTLASGSALSHLLAMEGSGGGDSYFAKFFVVANELDRTIIEPAAAPPGGDLPTRGSDSLAHPFYSTPKQFCTSRNPSVFVLMRSKTSN